MKKILISGVFIFSISLGCKAQRTAVSPPDTMITIVDEPIIINVKKDKVDEDIIFTKVEIEPGFKGGSAAWLKYVQRNTQLSGYTCDPGNYAVTVKFIVDQKGQAGDFQIENRFDCGIEKEALRIVKSVPDWTPGMQNGAIIKAYVKLEVPIIIN